MVRVKTYAPLNIYHNGEIVGYLSKQLSGAIEFIYDDQWLNSEYAYPISLSLPLREGAFKGACVVAVFDNLLPDLKSLRSSIAEKVGASGTDAYSLLAHIGRDCVGALQIFPEDAHIDFSALQSIQGDVINDDEIERLLNNLTHVPLGLDMEHDFRISVAGAQEKTALLFHEGKWMRPLGVTPTTHIFKKQIGELHLESGTVDLSHSVENEFYGLTVMKAFGLEVNKTEIKTFGDTKALVVERFDRIWQNGMLVRVPQEDCCQALSIPPEHKYQNDNRPSHMKQPSIVEILNLLKGSNRPAIDQKAFLKAQVIFWLIGATDGHGKNFSIFLGQGGRFTLTPFYDVLTLQPSFDAQHIQKKAMKMAIMKMAMAVGNNNHYIMDKIQWRHFEQTAQTAKLPAYIAQEVRSELLEKKEGIIQSIEEKLPSDFPMYIHDSVTRMMMQRLNQLE